MPRPSPSVLETDPTFRLEFELDFEQVLPFVLKEIKRRGIFSVGYFTFTGLSLLALSWVLIQGLKSGDLHLSGILGQGLVGILGGSFLVIPVHEAIHGLAYRILGAKNIVFGKDLRQFIFYVTANRYPINKVQTIFLAMLPFMLINALLWTSSILWFPGRLFAVSVFLFCHNLMCIGDFAIANFVNRIGGHVYSFDDVGKGKNYFYTRDS